MAIVKYLRLFTVVAGFATMAVATPAPSKTVSTRGDAFESPTCVTGVPAAMGTDPGSWPISWYATVTPTADAGVLANSRYKLDVNWSEAHFLEYTKKLAVRDNPPSDGYYMAFKCQFKCNARDFCVSYFVNLIAGDRQGHTCELYNSLIDPSKYVYDNNSQPYGGYNKLCNPPPNPFNHNNKTRRGLDDLSEADLSEVVHPVGDIRGWSNYFPSKDFQKVHGGWHMTTAQIPNGQPGNPHGFDAMRDYCGEVCASEAVCESFFVAYGKPDADNGYPVETTPEAEDWICLFFNAPLAAKDYTQAIKPDTWTQPHGFNMHSSVEI